MDNRRYQELRTYCMQELGENMNLPGYKEMMQVAVKAGGAGIGRIKREEELARHLFQCHDLNPKERAAAYLLAVITNHRIATWQREPEPHNGNEPAPPLSKVETDALIKVTSDAVRRYAAFLPEREAAILLNDCKTALEAAPATKAKTEGELDGMRIPLPIKSRYSIKEAAKYIANATGENVTISQVIDWGAQGFYGLYLLTNWAFKYEGEAKVFEKDISVKFHPNAEQSTALQSGYSICIESGLLEGRKVIFMLSQSSRLFDKNRTNEHSVDFNYSNIALLGAELADFTAGFAKLQKTVKPADAPAAKVEAEPVATHAPATTTNKLRRNSLDPAIDDAIKQAGSNELAAVYLKLKAKALDEVMPFTGALDGDALCYTDDENNPAKLTKDALRKRLKRR